MYALNENGSLKWSFATGYQIHSRAAMLHGDTMYVGSMDNCVYALSTDGRMRWRFQTRGAVNTRPVVGADGVDYVGSADTYLYALKDDGALLWSYKTDGETWTSPAVGADGTVFVVTGELPPSRQILQEGSTLAAGRGQLYALDGDGSLRWSLKVGGRIYSNPAVGPGNTLYIGCWDHYVYCINTAD